MNQQPQTVKQDERRRSIWLEVERTRASVIKQAAGIALKHLTEHVLPLVQAAEERGDVTPDMIEALITPDALNAMMEEIYFKIGKVFGKAVFDGLTDTGKAIKREFDEDIFLDTIRAYLTTDGAAQVVDMTASSKRMIQAVIDRGVAEGQGIDKIARGLRKELLTIRQLKEF